VEQFPQQKFHVMVPGERMVYLKTVEDGLTVMTP
jgi:hypothetical protein